MTFAYYNHPDEGYNVYDAPDEESRSYLLEVFQTPPHKLLDLTSLTSTSLVGHVKHTARRTFWYVLIKKSSEHVVRGFRLRDSEYKNLSYDPFLAASEHSEFAFLRELIDKRLDLEKLKLPTVPPEDFDFGLLPISTDVDYRATAYARFLQSSIEERKQNYFSILSYGSGEKQRAPMCIFTLAAETRIPKSWEELISISNSTFDKSNKEVLSESNENNNLVEKLTAKVEHLQDKISNLKEFVEESIGNANPQEEVNRLQSDLESALQQLRVFEQSLSERPTSSDLSKLQVAQIELQKKLESQSDFFRFREELDKLHESNQGKVDLKEYQLSVQELEQIRAELQKTVKHYEKALPIEDFVQLQESVGLLEIQHEELLKLEKSVGDSLTSYGEFEKKLDELSTQLEKKEKEAQANKKYSHIEDELKKIHLNLKKDKTEQEELSKRINTALQGVDKISLHKQTNLSSRAGFVFLFVSVIALLFSLLSLIPGSALPGVLGTLKPLDRKVTELEKRIDQLHTSSISKKELDGFVSQTLFGVKDSSGYKLNKRQQRNLQRLLMKKPIYETSKEQKKMSKLVAVKALIRIKKGLTVYENREAARIVVKAAKLLDKNVKKLKKNEKKLSDEVFGTAWNKFFVKMNLYKSKQLANIKSSLRKKLEMKLELVTPGYKLRFISGLPNLVKSEINRQMSPIWKKFKKAGETKVFGLLTQQKTKLSIYFKSLVGRLSLSLDKKLKSHTGSLITLTGKREKALILLAGKKEKALDKKLKSHTGSLIALAGKREKALMVLAGKKEKALDKKLKSHTGSLITLAGKREKALILLAGKKEKALDKKLKSHTGSLIALAGKRGKALTVLAGKKEKALDKKLKSHTGSLIALAGKREKALTVLAGKKEKALYEKLNSLEKKLVSLSPSIAQNIFDKGIEAKLKKLKASSKRDIKKLIGVQKSFLNRSIAVYKRELANLVGREKKHLTSFSKSLQAGFKASSDIAKKQIKAHTSKLLKDELEPLAKKLLLQLLHKMNKSRNQTNKKVIRFVGDLKAKAKNKNHKPPKKASGQTENVK